MRATTHTPSQEIRQLSKDEMIAFLDNELARLKAENEALRGRVADLQSIIYDANLQVGRLDSAFILRKQAVAVEEQAREWSPEDQTYSGRKPHKELIAAAQRLHTQADELEAHD